MDEGPDIIRPVIEPAIQSTKPLRPKRSAFNRLTLIVMWLAFIVSAVCFGLGVYFFAGFVENDRGVAHLAYALFISMSVSAVGYVPALWVGFLARTTLNLGARHVTWILTLLLILPWLGLCWLAVRLGGVGIFVGTTMGVVAFVWLFWALIVALRAFQHRAKPQ